MRSIFEKKRLFIIALVSLAFLVCGLYFLPNNKSVKDETFAVRLEIASIEVDAPIESVGITSEGEMGVPEGAMDVGWYSRGPQSGEEGSAVIAGHRGWKNGERAVFDNLDKLQKGDQISILNSDGSRIYFVVREKRIYDKDAIAPEIFVSKEGMRLNLITCVGEWNESLKSSDERLVVFTERVK